MKFSIITPSFRNSDWLKLCIASVADQAGVTTASVDLDAARAVVEYDPARLDVGGIQAAIADAGYAATPVG